jgi:hypothetical protein
VCVSEDRPGFIVNRVLMPMINEAFFCIQEVRLQGGSPVPPPEDEQWFAWTSTVGL